MRGQVLARSDGEDEDQRGGVGGIARRAIFTGVNMWLAAGVAGALTFAATFAFAPVRKMVDAYITSTMADALVGAWAPNVGDCATPLVIGRAEGRLEMSSAGEREILDPLEKAEGDWLSAPATGIELRRNGGRLEMRLAKDPRSVTPFEKCAA